MKKFLLLLLPLATMAQTFPFDEGFHGTISGTLPMGWSGDMKVQADHGLNDLKGMTADIGSTDMEDSSVTPWIGPLDNNTEFYFWYRMVHQFIYPSTEKHLSGSGRFIISYSTDSVNFTPIYVIDSTNHQPSLNFKKVIFAINNLGGQIVKFKFWCKYGGGNSYFVDIDSIKVRQNTGTGVQSLDPITDFQLYPNPMQAGQNTKLLLEDMQNKEVILFDVSGKLLFQIPVQANISPFTLPTANLSKGVYFLQYGNRTRKLVVQ
jgi:hypothetical protein